MHEHFEFAPEFGMFLGLLGRAFVFAAAVFYVFAIVAWFINGRVQWLGKAAFWTGAGFVTGTMGVLVALLLMRQYQFQYVWRNTEEEMAFAFRLSAAWASQEGSFLLWAMMSGLSTAIAAPFTGKYRRWFTIVASVALLSMLAITAYESPFKIHPELLEMSQGGRIPMPADGNGLNPILVNYWMAIHPWVIFIGFGSLLILFAWAASAVLSSDWKTWIVAVRPWGLFSMLMTGLGLIMGGLWAYETLGWGGFWAWDPVENVSLVPFLAVVAFVHGAYMQVGRGKWPVLNIVLGALPFAWFVYGTYLTRSGALVNVSVHSFAEMNQGAHWILLGLVCLVWLSVVGLGFCALFRRRSVEVQEERVSGNRSVGLAFGVVLIYSIAIMAAFGMSLPFFATLFGFQGRIVEQGTYNSIVGYAFVPAMLLMACVPFFGWTKTSPERLRSLSNAFFLSALLFGGLVFWLVRGGLTMDGSSKMPFLSLVVFFMLLWVTLFSLAANGVRIYERLRAKAGGIGPFMTHAGVSLLLLGLIVSQAFEKTQRAIVSTESPGFFSLGPSKSYLASLDGQWTERGLFNPQNHLRFTITDVATGKAFATPVNFYVNARDGKTVIRPNISRHPLYDLYFFIEGLELKYGEPIELKLGERAEQAGFTITYLNATRSGEAGSVGTEFGAELKVEWQGGSKIVEPTIRLTEHGTMERPAMAGESAVVYLERVDAADNTATVSLWRTSPLLLTVLFFKPLTILIWIGAGIMCLGSVLAISKRTRDVRNMATEDDALSEATEIEDPSRTGDLCEPGLRR